MNSFEVYDPESQPEKSRQDLIDQYSLFREFCKRLYGYDSPSHHEAKGDESPMERQKEIVQRYIYLEQVIVPALLDSERILDSTTSQRLDELQELVKNFINDYPKHCRHAVSEMDVVSLWVMKQLQQTDTKRDTETGQETQSSPQLDLENESSQTDNAA